GTALDVFGAIAKALADREREPAGIARRDPAVGAVAPARREIEPEKADLLPFTERLGGGIARTGQRIDPQGHRIGRMHEAGRAGEDAGERPAARIGGGNEQIGQQREEFAMLVRHEIADPGAGRALAGTRLGFELVGMERRERHWTPYVGSAPAGR